jgi:hypothetical protein
VIPPPVRESPLPAAANLRPGSNHVIGPDQLRRSLRLTFQWEEVPGANGYLFTLRDDSGGEILGAGPQAENFYTLDLRNIGGGSFLWQVEAVRRNGRIIERRGVIAEHRFVLEVPRPGNPRIRDPGTLYGIAP